MPSRVALFLSPHLDDVAFSCGGLAAILAERGWNTVLATIFTRSVLPARGFALACQLDKGLTAGVDYMALRRAEDVEAARILHVGSVRWMDLPEAPHRGYGSAAELFADVRPDDAAGTDVAAALHALDAECAPHLVLAPQALGRHVDHRIVADCALAVFGAARLGWYRDTPYAIREPNGAALHAAQAGVSTLVDISAVLERKIAAASAYATQVGFQFGSAGRLAESLRGFAVREGMGRCAAERIDAGTGLEEVKEAALF